MRDDDEDGASMRDGMRDLIRWEREERARTLIEQGDLGADAEKIASMTGHERYGERLAAIAGDSSETRLAHFRHSIREAEAQFPEIYVIKKGARFRRSLAEELVGAANATNLSKDDFVDLYSAVAFGNANGVALDVHVVIQWGYLGYRDHQEAADALQEDFIKHLDLWYYYWRKKDVSGEMPPLCWVYSHECSYKGDFHTHFLTHVPVWLRDRFKKWITKRAQTWVKDGGGIKGAVKVVCRPSDPIGRQWIFLQYLCKGLDQNAMVPVRGRPCLLANFIQFQYRNPGNITCKQRSGMSDNLNSTSRKQAGFVSAAEAGEFDRRVLYSSSVYDEAWRRWQLAQNFDSLAEVWERV